MTHTITIRPTTDERPGWTEVNLTLENQEHASNCGILRLQMQIGAAVVRMDGIGGVHTEEAYRNRGLARHVLNAAIAHMTAGDAALTMLYGITDFYPKFGYTTAGPDYLLQMPVPPDSLTYDAGWQVRAFQPDDFDAIRSLYDGAIVGTSGAAVRDPAVYPWTRLRAIPEAERWNECRVVVDEQGVLRGYAWRGSGCGFFSDKDAPGKLLFSDVIARDPAAADILLDACITWAQDEARRQDQPVSHVEVVLPPEGYVATAAMTRTATFTQSYSATGGSMVRVLDVERLLRAMLPEFRQRMAASQPGWTGTLHIVTEIGSASLQIGNDDVTVVPAAHPSHPAQVVRLPQAVLGRLTMGTMPPYTLLARLDEPPAAIIQDVFAALFPQRHPHMFLADRY